MDIYAQQQIQSIYRAQSQILKELAEKSNCIMVGRCADYILREFQPYRLFIYASMESHNLTAKEIKKYIKKVDKQRSGYYEYYTGQKWGEKENYYLCINTTNLEIKQIVKYIAKMFKD